MTGLEDRLHRALDLELETEVGPMQMLDDVRRGAKRRQARRRTTGLMAAAAVLVVGVVVGGAILTRGESEPRPAPQPSETAIDPDQDGNRSVDGPKPGRALQVEAADGQVFATSNEADCGCSAFWRLDGTAWERLYDFSRGLRGTARHGTPRAERLGHYSGWPGLGHPRWRKHLDQGVERWRDPRCINQPRLDARHN